MKLVTKTSHIIDRVKKGGKKVIKRLEEFLKLLAVSDKEFRLKVVRDVIIGTAIGVAVTGTLLAIDLTVEASK